MADFSKAVTNVVVISDSDADVYDEVVKLNDDAMPTFKKQKGFVNGTILKSDESRKIVTILQWESKADHEACKTSPNWMKLKGGPRWAELMQTGKLRMQPEVYSVLANS